MMSEDVDTLVPAELIPELEAAAAEDHRESERRRRGGHQAISGIGGGAASLPRWRVGHGNSV